MDEPASENRLAARLLVRSAIRRQLFEMEALDAESLTDHVLAGIESRHLKPALAELAKDE